MIRTVFFLELPDVAHTFKKENRLVVQMQGRCFPMPNKDPQHFLNLCTEKKQFPEGWHAHGSLTAAALRYRVA